MSSSPALSILNLNVIYDPGKAQTKAVDSLSLDIDAGEVFGLLGPNGAGKSSVISSITGLLPVKSGRIEVGGFPAGSVEAKSLLGVVPQELVHHGYFSVNEILNFFSGYYGKRRNQDRIDYLLDKLALTDKKHRQVSQLSGGMKRRLLIAKALVHSPKILLLDEPSAGVDIELRSLLWDFVKELQAEGSTILLTTHYLEEAQRLCDRVAIMSDGRLLMVEGTLSMIERLSHRRLHLKIKETSLLESVRVGRLDSSIEVVRKSGSQLELRVMGAVNVQEVLDRIRLPLSEVLDIRMEEGVLEEAFLKVLQQERSQARNGVKA